MRLLFRVGEGIRFKCSLEIKPDIVLERVGNGQQLIYVQERGS